QKMAEERDILAEMLIYVAELELIQDTRKFTKNELPNQTSITVLLNVLRANMQHLDHELDPNNPRYVALMQTSYITNHPAVNQDQPERQPATLKDAVNTFNNNLSYLSLMEYPKVTEAFQILTELFDSFILNQPLEQVEPATMPPLV